jgi:uncharacterized protein YehS (DUF1456 family)
MEAGDQVLRRFLDGLIIYKRGPKDQWNHKKMLAELLYYLEGKS